LAFYIWLIQGFSKKFGVSITKRNGLKKVLTAVTIIDLKF
jgi:hypothetical protein